MDAQGTRYATIQGPTRRAYVYSLLFHVVLAVWMYNTLVKVEVPETPFFEISLGAVSRARIEDILDTQAAQRTQAMSPQERIDVPERRMLEIEEPTISVPSQTRLESRDIVSGANRVVTDIAPPAINLSGAQNVIGMDRKESFQGSRISVGEQPGAGMETGVIGAAEAVSFSIEGEIAGRRLLSNPLPQYPEGLNKSATIRISFAVLPDGTVSSAGMVPVRKENAVLEELAMNTLRLWRFSPQPEGDQRTQRGVITFIFEIR